METQANKPNKKQFYIIIAIAVVTAVASQIFFDKASGNSEVTYGIQSINKSCPIKITDYVQLDRVEETNGKELVFYFTATKWTAAEIEMTEFKSHAVPPFSQMIKNNEKLNELRKTMTFFYEYKDKNGEKIMLIKTPPGDINEEADSN